MGHSSSHLSVGLIKSFYPSPQTSLYLFHNNCPLSTVEHPAVPFSQVISEATSWALVGVGLWSTARLAALHFSASLLLNRPLGLVSC